MGRERVLDVEQSLGFKFRYGLSRDTECRQIEVLRDLLERISELRDRFASVTPKNIRLSTVFNEESQSLFDEYADLLWTSDWWKRAKWLVRSNECDWSGRYTRDLYASVPEDRAILQQYFLKMVYLKVSLHQEATAHHKRRAMEVTPRQATQKRSYTASTDSSALDEDQELERQQLPRAAKKARQSYQDSPFLEARPSTCRDDDEGDMYSDIIVPCRANVDANLGEDSLSRGLQCREYSSHHDTNDESELLEDSNLLFMAADRHPETSAEFDAEIRYDQACADTEVWIANAHSKDHKSTLTNIDQNVILVEELETREDTSPAISTSTHCLPHPSTFFSGIEEPAVKQYPKLLEESPSSESMEFSELEEEMAMRIDTPSHNVEQDGESQHGFTEQQDETDRQSDADPHDNIDHRDQAAYPHDSTQEHDDVIWIKTEYIAHTPTDQVYASPSEEHHSVEPRPPAQRIKEEIHHLLQAERSSLTGEYDTSRSVSQVAPTTLPTPETTVREPSPSSSAHLDSNEATAMSGLRDTASGPNSQAQGRKVQSGSPLAYRNAEPSSSPSLTKSSQPEIRPQQEAMPVGTTPNFKHETNEIALERAFAFIYWDSETKSPSLIGLHRCKTQEEFFIRLNVKKPPRLAQKKIVCAEVSLRNAAAAGFTSSPDCHMVAADDDDTPFRWLIYTLTKFKPEVHPELDVVVELSD